MLLLGFIFHLSEMCAVEGAGVNEVICKILFSGGKDGEWRWLVVLM